MSADPLKIKVSRNLPPETELLSCAQGIDKIQALAAVHEMDRSSLDLELALFATYAMAHQGERFLYCQQFGCLGVSIGLLFLCGPELRNQMMFVFRTQTETNAQVDCYMTEMEPLLKEMGVQYYRGVCGIPKARVRVIDDFEIQAPLLVARAQN
jgi:hypothetical protein